MSIINFLISITKEACPDAVLMSASNDGHCNFIITRDHITWKRTGVHKIHFSIDLVEHHIVLYWSGCGNAKQCMDLSIPNSDPVEWLKNTTNIIVMAKRGDKRYYSMTKAIVRGVR